MSKEPDEPIPLVATLPLKNGTLRISCPSSISDEELWMVKALWAKLLTTLERCVKADEAKGA